MMDANVTAQPEDPPQPPPVYLWLQATLEEVEAADFEAPIADSTATKVNEIEQLYHAAVKAAEARNDISASRVFSMLAAVTSMFFRPRDIHEPFGPMMVMTNGRSPAPADYRGHVEQLASMARRAKHSVLRARLSDLTWLLDRKRADAGARILEIQKRVKPDPEGWTSRDYINYGRR